MSEIAKCPVCGAVPRHTNAFGCYSETYECCGFAALSAKLWNSHAAAMELAKAEAWFMETEDFDWSGPLREENEDAFREWDGINYKAGEDLNKAQQRVLEVFNG